MKIGIVGAGIAGLSVYLSLAQHLAEIPDLEIKIYEAYDLSKYIKDAEEQQQTSADLVDKVVDLTEAGFDIGSIGGGIGVSKNGLKVLSRLGQQGSQTSDSLLREAIDAGHVIIRWEMSCARGWKLADMNVTAALPRNDKDKTPSAIMIGRHVFWSILFRRVVDYGGKEAIHQKRISSITSPDNEDESPVLHFADGSNGVIDLIIGADGLRSTVRRCMFNAPSAGKEETSVQNDYVTPKYEGLCGVGGFVPSSVLANAGHKQESMSIIFGSTGFFGCGHITPQQGCQSALKHIPASTSIRSPRPEPERDGIAMYWSTFPTPIPNPDPKSYTVDKIFTRHKHWHNPTLQAILAHVAAHPSCQVPTIWPTYTTPPLPHWSTPSGRVILVGDAAHALQPSSGQGASQALEDAEGLGLLLNHYLSKSGTGGPALREAMQKFETIRIPRVHAIYLRGQRAGGMKKDMNILQEMLMYAAIKIISWFPDTALEKLIDYDLPADVSRIINQP